MLLEAQSGHFFRKTLIAWIRNYSNLKVCLKALIHVN